MNKEQQIDLLIEEIKKEFPSVQKWEGGVIFWNGHCPVHIDYDPKNGCNCGWYTSVIAIDPEDMSLSVPSRYNGRVHTGVTRPGLAKEYVMTGCYSYSSDPIEEFHKKKGVKSTWWNKAVMFDSLETCMRRFQMDKEALAKKKELGLCRR
jgi:hypothetical protein